MPSPTSGSPAKDRKVIQAPPWLVRLLTPLIARHAARELSEKYPGLGPAGDRGEDARRFPQPADRGRAARCSTRCVAAFPQKGDRRNETEKPVSAWVLLAANLVPLAGVLFWGWSVFALIALFWMENVIIGVFFVLRMLCADPRDPALWAGKLFMVPFFCFHYGMFTAIHGVFVFSMFGGKSYGAHGPAGARAGARARRATSACGCRSRALLASHRSRSCGTTCIAASSAAPSLPG